MALFDLSRLTNAGLAQTYGNNFNPDSGQGTTGLNYAGAFGVPGLTAAVKSGDGYTLYRGLDQERMKANATVNGNQANVGQWKADPTTSDAKMLMDGAMLAAAAYGGLNAGGFLGAGSAGAGSGAGFVGEGVGSGVPAWDGAMGGAMLEGGAAGGGGLLGGSVGELLGKVPTKAWTSLAGGLLSSAGGQPSGGGYSGPMPTITRGGWKPSVTPQYMQLTDVSKGMFR